MATPDGSAISILTVKHLGPQSSIMIVDILGEAAVIGVSNQQMSHITTIDDTAALERLKSLSRQRGAQAVAIDPLDRYRDLIKSFIRQKKGPGSSMKSLEKSFIPMVVIWLLSAAAIQENMGSQVEEGIRRLDRRIDRLEKTSRGITAVADGFPPDEERSLQFQRGRVLRRRHPENRRKGRYRDHYAVGESLPPHPCDGM